MQASPSLDVRAEVAAALQAGRPVVAMVSGPIAHTLPWPGNIEAFRQADAAVRQEGGVLAVAAVWRGRLTVGLEAAEVEMLARGASTLRASRRDLATAVVRGMTAATSVSASMYLAMRAGIRLLATGSIGGAARPGGDGEGHVWDISADLMELFQTPVAVVNAGARSVHNLAYTDEVLQTFRVPVLGYQTSSFPTFYMRAGRHPATGRADTPAEVAAFLTAHWGMQGGGVVDGATDPGRGGPVPRRTGPRPSDRRAAGGGQLRGQEGPVAVPDGLAQSADPGQGPAPTRPFWQPTLG